MAQRQIVNGSFQDASGNALNGGYITLRLNKDSQVGTTQLYSSTIITINLDVNGNVSGTVNLWPTDQMNWTDSTYIVKVFSASGQLAWGPHAVTLPSGVGSYDISQWVPSVNAI